MFMELDSNQIRGHVILVMAPTGSGKGSLVKRAKLEYPNLYETISCTSRKMRPDEVDGRDYYFITNENFDKKIEGGDFLEWAQFAGNKYGTLKSEILPRMKEREVVLVEIELQGVEQLLQLLPRNHVTIVYVDAGGWDVLKKRIETRAPMSEEEMNARHERFLVEKQYKPLADVIINNSSSLDEAYVDFKQVIDEAYKKCK